MLVFAFRSDPNSSTRLLCSSKVVTPVAVNNVANPALTQAAGQRQLFWPPLVRTSIGGGGATGRAMIGGSGGACSGPSTGSSSTTTFAVCSAPTTTPRR